MATGGLGGVMTAASRGARMSTSWSEGSVVGVPPGLLASEANTFVDVAFRGFRIVCVCLRRLCSSSLRRRRSPVRS